MSRIEIKPIEDNKIYEVNGKEILFQDDRVIAHEELTQFELKAFRKYREAYINSKHKGKHPKSVYY